MGNKLELVAKMSDPGHKQGRQGAIYDGREVYTSNLDWSATESEVTNLFSKYGKVERVRLLKNIQGKSKGTAFVVFESKVNSTKSQQRPDKS